MTESKKINFVLRLRSDSSKYLRREGIPGLYLEWNVEASLDSAFLLDSIVEAEKFQKIQWAISPSDLEIVKIEVTRQVLDET